MKFIQKYYKLFFGIILLFLVIFFWKWFIILLISLIIAYLLHPAVEMMEKIRINRTAAIIIVLLVVLLILYFLSVSMVPVLINQVKKLNNNIPEYTVQLRQITQAIRTNAVHWNIGNNDILDAVLSKMEFFITFITGAIITFLLFILSSLPFMVLVPVIVFYFLKDRELFYNQFLKLFSSRERGVQVISRIDKSVMGYVKGTLLDCLIVGIILTVGFYIFKLRFALITGSMAGLFVIIPYLGPLIGAIPPVIISIIQFGSIQKILFLLLFMGVVHIINGYAVQPKIIGESIHFHPLAVLFIVIIGTGLLGGIGLLIAIPVAIIMKESITSFLH